MSDPEIQAVPGQMTLPAIIEALESEQKAIEEALAGQIERKQAIQAEIRANRDELDRVKRLLAAATGPKRRSRGATATVAP